MYSRLLDHIAFFRLFFIGIECFSTLNILFFLLCLPVVTIGANLTALYSVTLKMARKEDVYPFKQYVQAFRQNFKQATLIWLGLLGIGGILFINYQLIQEITSLKVYLVPLIYFFGIFGFVYCLFVFSVLAQYKNSMIGTLRSTFFVILAFFPYAFLQILLFIGPVLSFIYWIPSWTPYLMYFYMLIGCSYSIFLSSFIFTHIFRKLLKGSQQKLSMR